jgi:hypothetical protein
MSELFPEGGPLKVKKVGKDQYSMQVAIDHAEEDGRIGRKCPNGDCSPAYFRVTPGTGLTNQSTAFCPYCRNESPPSDFISDEQKRYAIDMLKQQLAKGVQDTIRNALGLSSTNRRQLSGGLLSVSMEFKPGRIPAPQRPDEGILRRDVTCPECGLVHSVFGFAAWCPDCGRDIFATHIAAEIAVVRAMLTDVGRRSQALGPRVAASDVENAVEDLVSIFEATLKIEIRRRFQAAGQSEPEIDAAMKRLGSRLQNVDQAILAIDEMCEDVSLFQDRIVADRLNCTFQKRHPITHNLGVIDKKYLDRVRSGDQLGSEVRVSPTEVEAALNDVLAVLVSFHTRLTERLNRSNTS